MNTVIKNGLISIVIMLLVMLSSAVQSQGFTIKQDTLRANTSGITYAQLNVKNYNEYNQKYVVTRNGVTLKGELKLHPNQSRKVRIKLINKGYNKICLVSIPKKNQKRVIAFCDTVLVK